MFGKVKGKVNSRAGEIAVCLDIVSYSEDGCRIIYCPALDLSGYGRTEDAAQESFMVTLHEFLDYTLEHGTLRQVMEGLGWTVGEQGAVASPTMREMCAARPELKEIVSLPGLRRRRSRISLPAFV